MRAFAKSIQPKHLREATDTDIRAFLLELIEKKRYEAATIDQVISALRFLYVELYGRPLQLGDLHRPQKERRLPVTLSVEEVLSILEHARNVKHRTILMLIYSAGLRVGEAVRLKVADIDAKRRMIHVRGGKGKKDRYTLLADSVLDQLREYYSEYHPREYLFEGGLQTQAHRRAECAECVSASGEGCWNSKGGVGTQSSPCVCYPLA